MIISRSFFSLIDNRGQSMLYAASPMLVLCQHDTTTNIIVWLHRIILLNRFICSHREQGGVSRESICKIRMWSHLEYNFVAGPAIQKDLDKHAKNVDKHSCRFGLREMRRKEVQACTQHQYARRELDEKHLIVYEVHRFGKAATIFTLVLRGKWHCIYS